MSKFKVGDIVRRKYDTDRKLKYEVLHVQRNGKCTLRGIDIVTNEKDLIMSRKSPFKTVLEAVNRSPKYTDVSALIQKMGWQVTEFIDRACYK